ncbi:MAG: THUMP domain-containing protein [Cyanobacteria bacterium P01_A01_bin.123]
MAQYFASVAPGLTAIAAQELTALGANQVCETPGGVSFEGDRALAYRANLWCRIPYRILWQLKTVSARDAQDLYHGVQKIDWLRYIPPDATLAVTVTGKNQALNHSHYTALQVKNAIVDQQRQETRIRSSVDSNHPDVRVQVHIHRHRATISLDSSGDSLHRRGYRAAVGQAPLKETLAAALIELTDWQPHQPLLDPMCGSGTLLLEASLKALNLAPGLFRTQFGFERWPDFDADLWQHLRQEAEAQQQKDVPLKIWGCDRDPSVIQQAQANAHKGGLDQSVNFAQQELADLEAPTDQGILVCNPPYGERLASKETVGELYHLLGTTLKTRFRGWTAYVLSGNKALSQAIGMKSAKRVTVYNGTLKCQWLKYEIY